MVDMQCFERTDRALRCLLCGRGNGRAIDLPTVARHMICPACVSDIQTEAVWRLHADLQRRIAGQDRAVSVLAAAAYRHHRRERQWDDRGAPRAGNILLAGPPGVGKTRLIKAVASALDLPFVSISGIDLADSTAGTPLGLFERLARAAGRDPGRTGFGIVHVDRLDELATSGRPRVRHVDVASRAQRNLAALLAAAAGSRRGSGALHGRSSAMPSEELAEVLFLVEARSEIRAREHDDPRREAGGPVGAETATGGGIRIAPAPEDPARLGLLPELAAWFPIIISLEPLDTDDLLRVLVEPEDGIWQRCRNLFSARGATLSADPEALQAIAREAGRRGRGGWGLQEAMEERLLDLAFDLRPADGVREVRLRGDAFGTVRPVLLRGDTDPAADATAWGGDGRGCPASSAPRRGHRLIGSEGGL